MEKFAGCTGNAPDLALGRQSPGLSKLHLHTFQLLVASESCWCKSSVGPVSCTLEGPGADASGDCSVLVT
jgi:hypothetical protein